MYTQLWHASAADNRRSVLMPCTHPGVHGSPQWLWVKSHCAASLWYQLSRFWAGFRGSDVCGRPRVRRQMTLWSDLDLIRPTQVFIVLMALGDDELQSLVLLNFIFTFIDKSHLDSCNWACFNATLWKCASSLPTNQLGALRQGTTQAHFRGLYGTSCRFQCLPVATRQNLNIKVRPNAESRSPTTNVSCATDFSSGENLILSPWMFLICEVRDSRTNLILFPPPQDVSCSGQSQWAIQQNFLLRTDHMYRLAKQTAGVRPHHMILPLFSVSVDGKTLVEGVSGHH